MSKLGYREPIEHRFWKHVTKREDGCWEWTSQRNQGGYGQLRDRGHSPLAHRLSWEIHNGRIPWGMLVLHKCDHPWCVNPAHLYIGDYKDNSRDMFERGRWVKAGTHSGPMSRVRKLTDDQVRAIRKDQRHYVAVAMDHGISPHYAWEIMHRKRKTLVPD